MLSGTKINLWRNIREVMGLSLIFLVLALNSCAQRAPQVTTSIGVVSSMSFLNTSGGTLVTGNHADGFSFSQYFSAGQDILVNLELGIWDLAVVTYNGSEPLSGTLECATGQYRISDEVESLTLKVSSDNCSSTGVKKIKMRACEPTSFDEGSTLSMCLPSGASSGGDSLAMRSYQVSYLSHTNLEPIEGENFSQCIKEDDLEAGELVLFTGDHASIKNVPLIFKFFPTKDCSGSSASLKILSNLVDQQRDKILKVKKDYFNSLVRWVFLNAESSTLGIPAPDNTQPYVIAGQEIPHYLQQKGSTLTIYGGTGVFEDEQLDVLSYECFYDSVIDGDVNPITASPCTDLSGLSFIPSTGALNWVIGTSELDSYEFKIRAYDGDLYNSAQFIVNLYDSDSGKVPDLDQLKVWLQPKSSYLYKDAKATEHASESNQVNAWRNTIVSGNELPLIATTPYGNGPTFALEAPTSNALGASYTPELTNAPTLTFNADNKNALSLPDGSYDEGESITIVTLFTRNTLNPYRVNNIFSKGNSAISQLTAQARLNNYQEPEFGQTLLSGNLGTIDKSLNLLGTKTCLSYVIDGSTKVGKLYIDSDLASSQSNASVVNSVEPFIIGNLKVQENTTGLSGNISEILIWSKSLTQTEIQTECDRLNALYE